MCFAQQCLCLVSIRLEYDGHIVDCGGSRILDGNAYVADRVTTQAGIAWTSPDGGMISPGFEMQSARNDWRSHGGQVSLVFPFWMNGRSRSPGFDFG